jgi:DNA-binding transcriptional ArsR family regulator
MNFHPGPPPSKVTWTFLSNYAHILVCLYRDPLSRLRDMAEQVGITERAAQRIVSELEQAGVLTRIRDGRRNRYELHLDQPLRHPLEAHRTIGDLLSILDPRAAD